MTNLYILAILALAPNAKFSTADNKITQWESEEAQPSQDSILAKVTELEAEEANKAHNNSIYTAITELEAKQARPLREVYLDPENQEAKDKILLIDSEIEALRATLK